MIETSATVPVIDPSTGEVFADCPACDASHVDDAVAAARAAFPAWAALPTETRANFLLKIAEALENSGQHIAELTTREQGKPINAAIGEVCGGAVAWIRATAALRPPVDTIQDDENARIEVHHKPLGVVASITPWNYPIMIACWHIMPALIAGDTVVIKPSEMTPLGTLKLIELMGEILPAGVVNVVTGTGEIGSLLTSHPGVDKVVFTGSTGTGRKIMASAAPTLKRLTLELGGNDAGIVLNDIDIDAAAPALFQSAFGNCGQVCAALKRLYVPASIHDALVDKLADLSRQAILGNGFDEGVQFGPVQNKAQFDKVCALADDAKTRGGQFVTGGAPLNRPGYFFPLSIATNVKNGMRIVDEEQFGPLLPIIKYDTVEQAIEWANASENGLGGSVWTRDIDKGWKIAQQLECGTAWVNTHSALHPMAPFGGAKQSGIGVEFGWWGLADYMQLQTRHLNKALFA
nr:aldehyde dehydrogenase family protein [uncultured Hyphomonas sp.]